MYVAGPLLDGNRQLGTVATRVGYRSEAAFSIALSPLSESHGAAKRTHY